MASGLHGENGVDPETAIFLINSYVSPILLYIRLTNSVTSFQRNSTTRTVPEEATEADLCSHYQLIQKTKIVYSANLSNKLQYLNIDFSPGKLHPVLSAPVKSMCAVRRLPVRPKLRLLKGTYQLQALKVCFQSK